MADRFRLQVVNAETGAVVAETPLDIRAADHPFSSGKVGYFVSDKIRLPSVSGDCIARHQMTCSFVEIMPKAAK